MAKKKLLVDPIEEVIKEQQKQAEMAEGAAPQETAQPQAEQPSEAPKVEDVPNAWELSSTPIIGSAAPAPQTNGNETGKWEPRAQIIEDAIKDVNLNTKPAEPEDEYVASAVKAQEDAEKSFADLVLGMQKDADQAIAEGDRQIKDDLNAAKWTGITELAASIANMIGVGSGNAVSQQYKSYSQDWMQKADQSMREQRSRIDNLRQRQRENEYKMAQLRSQGALALSKAKLEAEQQKWVTAYRKAQVEYENARTDAARQKAANDARKAEVEIQAIQALANQRDASARSNLIRAGATAQNADSRASSVENQNANRDLRTGSQNMVDLSRAGLNWSKASGQPVQPPAGWSVQTPAAPSGNLPTAPSANRTTPSSLPVPPSKRKK